MIEISVRLTCDICKRSEDIYVEVGTTSDFSMSVNDLPKAWFASGNTKWNHIEKSVNPIADADLVCPACNDKCRDLAAAIRKEPSA